MWSTLVDNWYWFGGLLALAFLFRQARLYVLRKKKEREEKKDDTAVPDHGPQRYNTGNPYIDAAYEAEKEQTKPLTPEVPPYTPPKRNEAEDHYAKEKDAWEKRQADAERLIAEANQKAQFMMVEQGKSVRLTIYDPDTVESLDKLTVIEEILENEKGYVVGGTVHVVDKRPATPKQWLPAHARAAAQEAEKRRRTALRDGELFARTDTVTGAQRFESVDREVQECADRGRTYAKGTAAKAREEFKELLPGIRADAEKMAREKFVPLRMEQFQQQAAQDGTKVDAIVEAFVTQIGDEAVKAAEKRFSTPQPLTNELFMRAVDAGGWQMKDDGTPLPKEEQVDRRRTTSTR